MRIWHEQLISQLCQKHLCAMWREMRGAYKIITEHNTCSYSKHPATLEFIDAPMALWYRMLQVKLEMEFRGYHPKEMPDKPDKNGGQIKDLQTLNLSLCCGAEKTDYGFCSDCHENC